MDQRAEGSTSTGLSSSSTSEVRNATLVPNFVSQALSRPNSAPVLNGGTAASDRQSHAWGPLVPAEFGALRPVIIDGSNVAMQLGKKIFATRGILICARYFISRGHRVITFVPTFRRNQREDNFRRPMKDQHLLDWMYRHEMLVYTPSRNITDDEDHRRRIVCYDDYYIVQYAHQTGGVVVSKDQYRDVLIEHPEWADTIKNRLIMFSWAGEMFMVAEDPFGKRGPRLDELLRFGANDQVSPFMVEWTSEQRAQLLREIDEILVAPPPPPPSSDSQEVSLSELEALSAAPRFGFVRREPLFGFNHRSRGWMRQGPSSKDSPPSTAASTSKERDSELFKHFCDMFPIEVVEQVLNEYSQVDNLEVLSNLMVDALIRQTQAT